MIRGIQNIGERSLLIKKNVSAACPSSDSFLFLTIQLQ